MTNFKHVPCSFGFWWKVLVYTNQNIFQRPLKWLFVGNSQNDFGCYPQTPSLFWNILLNLGNWIETLHTSVDELLTNGVCVYKTDFFCGLSSYFVKIRVPYCGLHNSICWTVSFNKSNSPISKYNSVCIADGDKIFQHLLQKNQKCFAIRIVSIPSELSFLF